MSSFKIGDRAWNIGNYWVEIEEVEIASELKEENGIHYYKTKGITVLGSSGAKVEDLFRTKEEAMTELSRRKKREIEKNSSEINSVQDLLNMMFNCMHCEEYTDWEKIEVAKRKSKELLGVELKDDE